jgi:aspartyl-tRNA(Asn)/glutamyl-tRNA(Gln) amidotransferase subunit B
MTEMEPVIGLEIHAQLKTRTKLFCACPTEFGAPANTNICEVCAGQPGALPRVNREALRLAAKAGLALGSRVNASSLFSRKNYFYPDLPNGFQTSQLDPPICEGGSLSIPLEGGGSKTVRLNRIHLEDDAGKCLHDEARGVTLVDLNRAGTPLIEIVTEPDLSSSKEAADFLKALHALLIRLGVTSGRMEEGEFRCDVNISLRPLGSKGLGVRGEIKNLNSFKFAAQAIEFEIARQGRLYREGRPVLQETLHFDSVKGETRSLRSKEEAHDYRYFPQPDLPPVIISPELLEELRKSLPESRQGALARLSQLGLKEPQADLLIGRPGALEYLDGALGLGAAPQRVFSLMEEFLLPISQREGKSLEGHPFGPEKMAALAAMMDRGELGRAQVKELSAGLFAEGRDPEGLVKESGLTLMGGADELRALALEALRAHPQEAGKVRAGNDKILSFFVGKVMKLSHGRADPKKAGELLREIIMSEEGGGGAAGGGHAG